MDGWMEEVRILVGGVCCGTTRQELWWTTTTTFNFVRRVWVLPLTSSICKMSEAVRQSDMRFMALCREDYDCLLWLQRNRRLYSTCRNTTTYFNYTFAAALQRCTHQTSVLGDERATTTTSFPALSPRSTFYSLH
mmetsp:Transcript_6714/g.9824  ORF Transcript_6714/g.9824 Transcript_6714/m.9824 type:complete len:135 (-) Transcript_6714:33-437(-)